MPLEAIQIFVGNFDASLLQLHVGGDGRRVGSCLLLCKGGCDPKFLQLQLPSQLRRGGRGGILKGMQFGLLFFQFLKRNSILLDARLGDFFQDIKPVFGLPEVEASCIENIEPSIGVEDGGGDVGDRLFKLGGLLDENLCARGALLSTHSYYPSWDKQESTNEASSGTHCLRVSPASVSRG